MIPSVSAGGIRLKTIAAKTGNYTSTNADSYIPYDVSAGSATLTLHTPASANDEQIIDVVLQTAGSKNKLAVNFGGSNPVDLVIPNEGVAFRSNGTTWDVWSDRRIACVARMKRNTVRTLTNNTFIDVQLNNETFDNCGCADPTTNNNFECLRDAKWLVCGYCFISGTSITNCQAAIYVDTGGGYTEVSRGFAGSGSVGFWGLSAEDIISLSDGDTVTFYFYQSSSGDINTDTGATLMPRGWIREILPEIA